MSRGHVIANVRSWNLMLKFGSTFSILFAKIQVKLKGTSSPRTITTVSTSVMIKLHLFNTSAGDLECLD